MAQSSHVNTCMRRKADYIAAGERDISRVKWISKYLSATKTVLTGLCSVAPFPNADTCDHEPCSAVSLALRGSPLSAPNTGHISTNWSVCAVVFWWHYIVVAPRVHVCNARSCVRGCATQTRNHPTSDRSRRREALSTHEQAARTFDEVEMVMSEKDGRR